MFSSRVSRLEVMLYDNGEMGSTVFRIGEVHNNLRGVTLSGSGFIRKERCG